MTAPAHATALAQIVDHLDTLLRTGEIADYPNALNGLQLDSRRAVARVAAAVDFSSLTVRAAIEWNADLLLVHHGMFWGGLQPIRGAHFDRIAALVDAGMAVYASHLPLDMHPELGNNVLLARALGLEPSAGFARYGSSEIGVSGDADLSTEQLADRVRRFAAGFGHHLVVTPFDEGRRTRRWGLCTGAGASSATIAEAIDRGIDTVIVGEGPHHTAVEARDRRLVLMYAGHYATETLGIRALAEHLARTFGVEARFLDAPTGV